MSTGISVAVMGAVFALVGFYLLRACQPRDFHVVEWRILDKSALWYLGSWHEPTGLKPLAFNARDFTTRWDGKCSQIFARGVREPIVTRNVTAFDDHVAARRYFESIETTAAAMGNVVEGTYERRYLWVASGRSKKDAAKRLAMGGADARTLDSTPYKRISDQMQRRKLASLSAG
jgi:hypothetical protein